MIAAHTAVLVLITGDTIDKQYFGALSQYQIADTTVTTLLAIARVTHPHLPRKDSPDLTEEDQAQIVERVLGATRVSLLLTVRMQ